jgi:hypothetical protein
MLSKYIAVFLTFCTACNYINGTDKRKNQTGFQQIIVYDNPYKTINDISLPKGYVRVHNNNNSFGEWLRNIDLKKDIKVYKFDGTLNHNQNAQFAVLNISVGKQNLQQCADAVMRLGAEYLYKQNNFDRISFTDNNGTLYKFHNPYTRKNFDNYLNRVFGMCGSASLSKQLKEHVEMKDIQPGDVLIRGGFPGHAAIVIDVAKNNKGKKIYLLAQSYMPAQDIHVLNNLSTKLFHQGMK